MIWDDLNERVDAVFDRLKSLTMFSEAPEMDPLNIVMVRGTVVDFEVESDISVRGELILGDESCISFEISGSLARHFAETNCIQDRKLIILEGRLVGRQYGGEAKILVDYWSVS